MWEKLSNSGEALKLLIPNLVWKYGGGRSNDSYMVTSQKMNENEMGNRGSKSMLNNNIVKEQRVDGSYINPFLVRKAKIKDSMLRCTLMGLKRDYQVKTLSNQIINKRFYSSNLPQSVQLSKEKETLNPWTVVGFSDAESSFMVRIRKNSKYKTGWIVVAVFSIAVDKKDLFLLDSIKAFFGGWGSIKKHGKGTFSYRIESSEQILKLIIPFFDKYPLITEKLGDYILFKKVVELMSNKEHLTEAGLYKIVSLKASINKGLSEELQAAFPQCVPALRPIIYNKRIPDPNWLAGFVSGDGSFKFILKKSSSVKVGFQSILIFQITQHARDEKLMESLISYFECGYIEKDSRGPWLYYTVSNFTDIYNKIIPFFHQYNIIGSKNLDFNDWCEIATLIQDKHHLTPEGLNKIISLKDGMNKGRLSSISGAPTM